MYSDWLEAIANNKDLRGEDFRVLLVLLANCDNSSAEISQSEIANKVGLKRTNVSRAIKRLFSKGIIIKEPNPGKLTRYRFLVEPSTNEDGA